MGTGCAIPNTGGLQHTGSRQVIASSVIINDFVLEINAVSNLKSLEHDEFSSLGRGVRKRRGGAALGALNRIDEFPPGLGEDTYGEVPWTGRGGGGVPHREVGGGRRKGGKGSLLD